MRRPLLRPRGQLPFVQLVAFRKMSIQRASLLRTVRRNGLLRKRVV